MDLTIEQVGILSTFIISIIALIFSALAFFRGRNIDLQNQLHLKKLEAFESIIGEFVKLPTLYRKYSNELAKMDFNQLSNSDKEVLHEMPDLIDREIDEIQKQIGMKSIYFSSSLIEEFLTYFDSLNGNIDWPEGYPDQVYFQEQFESYIISQTQKLESLIDKMSLELGLEEFNRKLLKRVKKGDFRLDV